MFHDLEVTAVEQLTRDAVAITARPLSGTFDFKPGQYLTFRREFDGAELRRSYSICAAPGQGLRVGIKRVDGGAFSSWAQGLQPGDRLEAMTPMGSFHKPGGRHVLGFAAGSGITPILSILTATLAEDAQSTFTLVYGNRTRASIMFRDALSDLKDTYLGRLNIIHVLSGETQEIPLFEGRIDAAKCDALFQHWIDVANADRAYICGPEAMMADVASALEAEGMPKTDIRYELFGASQPGRAAKAPVADAAKGIPASVTLEGETRQFTLSPTLSLLDAARGQSLDAPFACCAGVCSTCKARVTDGEVEMAANHALEDYEVEQGFVLTCQAYARSDRVAWDYDQAGH